MNNKFTITSIFVEGNVGAGKSTFLSLIKKKFDAQILYEPHHLWQNVDDHNLLEQFFLDQKRWAFALQTYITMTRIDQFQQADAQNQGQIQLIERSIYSGRYCFAQNAADIGLLNDLEWSLYKKFWNREEKDVPRKPSGFIYLQTPAELCYERIAKRGRSEEEPITLDYVRRLGKKHDDWFIHQQGVDKSLLQVPVLVLDNTRDFVEDEAVQQEYVEKIQTFTETIQNT